MNVADNRAGDVRATAAWLAAGAAFIWFNAVSAAIGPISLLLMPIRIALAALAAALGIAIARSPFRQMILSPIYLLGVFFLIAYSLIPAIQYNFSDYLPLVKPHYIRASSYYGSFGEILVLQFAAFCLTLAAMNLRWARAGIEISDTVTTHRLWTMAVAIAAIMVTVATLVPVLAEYVTALKNFLASGIGREIWSALAPVSSVSIVTICYVGAIRKGCYLGFAIAVVAAFFAVKLSTALVMTPAFISLCALILIGSIRYSGYRFIAAFGGGAVVFLVIIFLGIGVFRYSALAVRNTGPVLAVAVMHKVFYRQTNTAWCFNKIVGQRGNLESSGNPFYFASAIIPRSLWPDKPNLSRGYEFSSEYCWPEKDVGKRHAEMITLIGEPALEAGLPGVAVMQAVIGIALLALGMVLSSGTPITVIGVVAMLPWLINFQQHFALYFANSVKMFLTMAPLLLVLGFFARRAEKASAAARETGTRA